jgi:CheY-like chemotaxis protein
MSGYDLCREIRTRPACKNTPVVFISGIEDVDSRLKAYEAGGDDFIIKPFELKELELKIGAICRSHEFKLDLQERISESETLATQVLTTYEELAELNKFLHTLCLGVAYRDVATSLTNLLGAFRLSGAVQFRLPGFEITLNQAGEVCPLEASIIHQVQSSDTVVQFKRRAAYNYGHVSLLVSDMPVDDATLNQRLKGYLTAAMEMANMKLDAMVMLAEKDVFRHEIVRQLQDIDGATVRLKKSYLTLRQQGTEATDTILSRLASGLAQAALVQSHEESLLEGVKEGAQSIVDLIDIGDETGQVLNGIVSRLRSLLEKS